MTILRITMWVMKLLMKKSREKILIELEYSNLTLKNIDEKDFIDHDMEEIKSFLQKSKNIKISLIG